MAKRFTGIEKDWEETQALIAERNFHLFPSFISDSENATADWPHDRPLEGFLDLAQALSVQLIYGNLGVFSYTTILELEEQALGKTEEARPTLPSFPDVEKLKDNAQQYVGRPFFFSLEWLYQGVVHSYVKIADWYDDLTNRAEALKEVSERHRQEVRDRRITTREEQATTLAHSKAFQQARTYTAHIAATKKLYPGEDAHQLTSRALEIYESEIVPVQEEATAQKAHRMLDSGVSMTKTAAQLGMTTGKLEPSVPIMGETTPTPNLL